MRLSGPSSARRSGPLADQCSSPPVSCTPHPPSNWSDSSDSYYSTLIGFKELINIRLQLRSADEIDASGNGGRCRAQ
jgi:hypothetical protein